MFKIYFKIMIWLGIGIVTTVLINGSMQTTWKYTFHSTIAPGSQITVTQVDQEPVHAEVETTTSHEGTIDIGAPIALVGMYFLGSIMSYGLKERRKKFIT